MNSEFLKCAFAPVDFNNEVPNPIPDASGARVVVKRHKYVGTMNGNGTIDQYVVLAPNPGVAFNQLAVPTGYNPDNTTILSPVVYRDTDALMPIAGTNENFNSFRFVSNYIEFVPTINATSWSGSITVWKVPITQYIASDATQDELVGLTSIQQPANAMYVAGNNLGAYAFATQMGPWTYTPVNSLPLNFSSVSPPGGATAPAYQRVQGWGNLDTVIIKITGNFSYSIKVGCCVEYTVGTASALYEFSRLNTMSDPAALAAYKQIAAQLPVAVNYFENAQFWDRVLQIIKQLSGAMSIVPGPIGMTSQGVNLIANAISMMT